MHWRKDDLRTVDDSLTLTRAGRPAVLTITGAAGIGRPSLLSEVIRRAADFVVVRAEGEEAGYGEPYRLVNQLDVSDVHAPGER